MVEDYEDIADNFEQGKTEAWQCLSDFLENANQIKVDTSRRPCPTCGASRSLYCFDCCRLLVVPSEEAACDIHLPFSVDLILDDRRASATGVQAFTMLQQQPGESPDKLTHHLFDQSKGEGISDYTVTTTSFNPPQPQPGVYLLFPSEKSVGLSTVAPHVRRLVLLDCKWSKSNIRRDERLAVLPRVHLDGAPSESFYWRWHNSGQGMLSTIEAIYFAAWEVAAQHGWSLSQRKDLVYLLWIFAQQRALIRRQYEIGNGHRFIPHVPFSEDAKAMARKLREKEKEKRTMS